MNAGKQSAEQWRAVTLTEVRQEERMTNAVQSDDCSVTNGLQMLQITREGITILMDLVYSTEA
jgi:hypothetical protein